MGKCFHLISGRDFSKPIAICVSEIADVFDWGLVTVPFELLTRLLPGPVTLFFERKPELNTEFNPSKHHFKLKFLIIFISSKYGMFGWLWIV